MNEASARDRKDMHHELAGLVRGLATRIRGDIETGREASFIRWTPPPVLGHENANAPAALSSASFPHATSLPLSLTAVREELGDCRRCPLEKTRRRLVFGEGNEQARLAFVGEAPGADEDEQGRPFVGRAGQLLSRIIAAMELKREEVYICNILKCRPPGNRNPLPGEIQTCEPFLIRQLQAIRPRVIVALGTFAAKTLLQTESPITVLRGRFHAYQGISLMPTYHPAYLLRNPSAKKAVWEDMRKVMKELAAPA